MALCPDSPIGHGGGGSACAGGDEVERLASGEDADVAERAEFEQIAVARDDEGGLCAEGAGEDVIIVGVAHGGFDHGGPDRCGERTVARDHLHRGAADLGDTGNELLTPEYVLELGQQRWTGLQADAPRACGGWAYPIALSSTPSAASYWPIWDSTPRALPTLAAKWR